MIGIMEITFIRLRESEYQDFCNDVKEILSIAVVETFGRPEDGSEIIPNDEILGIVSDPECDTYAVFADGVEVGGVVIRPDAVSRCNSAELFYIYPERHGKGLGLQVWQAIERLYPETKVWRLVTPYFEKRNIRSTSTNTDSESSNSSARPTPPPTIRRLAKATTTSILCLKR